MNIQIRKANLHDAKTIAEFNCAMAQETEHIQLDNKKVLSGVEALLQDSSKGFYVVAEIENIIVGQLMITFEWSDWRNGTFWWIQSVYVKPEYRKFGVFKKMYEYIKGESQKSDTICGLRLYVEKENTVAQSVYAKLGMHETSYKMYEVDFVLKR